jgi:MoaA/NifB/PqqE/SkfB family radical SAM enzyme
MSYKFMRLTKYYDAFRSNSSFLKTSFKQKMKIIVNILKFLKTNLTNPLVVKNKPIIAQIEPTSECNLRCEMCVRENIGVPIGTMSLENFKKIIDKLDSLFKLHLSGQGEPFLNKEIFEMIKYANKKGIIVYFATNGTCLTKEVIDKICSVEIGEIGISIDSPNKEVYERIRKGAKLERVLENIKNLVHELKKRKKKTIVSIATVILKDNLNETSEFVLLAKKLGVKKIGFQTIQKKDDYLDKYNSKAKSQALSNLNKKLKEKIDEAKKIAKKNEITLIFDEEKSPGCVWPWRSIYITWNGYVTPCCKILNYRDPPYFGNILTDDIWKIWNSKNYQIFRKLLRKRKAPICCRGCDRV